MLNSEDPFRYLIATIYGGGGFDSFMVSGLSASTYYREGEVPSVPLPAGGSLMLSGLFALAWMRRRVKATK